MSHYLTYIIITGNRSLKLEELRRSRIAPFNYGLQVVRHILNLAASEWMDENGLTWIEHAPKIKLLPERDKRDPYPLFGDEQLRLLSELPDHLAKMAVFKVNSGCREQEVCGLRWDWEIEIPEMNTSVFIIPADKVKNREDRLVVLNRVARAIIEEMQGIHPEYVFTYQGKPIGSMNTKAWRNARDRAGLPRCGYMISSTRLGGGCVQRGSRLSIGKTCWGTNRVESPRITLCLSFRILSQHQTRCATTNGTKMEQWSS
jgi:integrase